jgi:hypothetical protein
MLDKAKNKTKKPAWFWSDERPWLERAHARHQDRAATRQLAKAIAKKERTVAELKRLGMELED